MALSQKHRGTIYERLAPILGEAEAEALLSQFPAHELDELATKDFVRTEIAQLRVEMHQLVNRLFVSMVGAMVGVAGVALAIARIG